jgi:hypothetical protein
VGGGGGVTHMKMDFGLGLDRPKCFSGLADLHSCVDKRDKDMRLIPLLHDSRFQLNVASVIA